MTGPGLERRHSTISSELFVGHPSMFAIYFVFCATFSVYDQGQKALPL